MELVVNGSESFVKAFDKHKIEYLVRINTEDFHVLNRFYSKLYIVHQAGQPICFGVTRKDKKCYPISTLLANRGNRNQKVVYLNGISLDCRRNNLRLRY